MLWIIFLISIVWMIVGLLLIGPQVNKHQIRPYSIPTWILRSGVLLLLISVIGLQSDATVIQLAQILAVMLIASSIIIVNHELVQAGDLKHDNFEYHPTVDMLILIVGSLLSSVILLIGVVIGATWATPVSFVVIILVFLAGIRLALSAESQRAGFQAIQSLSAQILMMGTILLLTSIL